MGKTLYVADFSNHGQGEEIFDAFVASQSLHWPLVALGFCHGVDFLIVLRQDAVDRLELTYEQTEIHGEAA